MGPKALTGPMGLGPKGPGGPYLGPIKVKPKLKIQGHSGHCSGHFFFLFHLFGPAISLCKNLFSRAQYLLGALIIRANLIDKEPGQPI